MEVIEDQLVTIDDDGIILSVTSDDGPADVDLGEGMILLPGLVDTISTHRSGRNSVQLLTNPSKDGSSITPSHWKLVMKIRLSP